jgi:D-glycero-D-manno-heptose 1,7-bisphosphate phosphatase
VSASWSGSPERGPLMLRSHGDAPAATTPRPAVFLDRDGTLNEAELDPGSHARESPLSVDQVRLIDGAAAAVLRFVEAGYTPVCVTNQPSAAKGKLALPTLLAIHEHVLALLTAQGVQIELSILCPHHPDGVVAELSRVCGCRKPAPGMLEHAAAELALELPSSWMIGDTDADLGAGSAAGCKTALIEYPPSAHKRTGDRRADVSAPDIASAAAKLLDHARG